MTAGEQHMIFCEEKTPLRGKGYSRKAAARASFGYQTLAAVPTPRCQRQ